MGDNIVIQNQTFNTVSFLNRGLKILHNIERCVLSYYSIPPANSSIGKNTMWWVIGGVVFKVVLLDALVLLRRY